MNDNRIKSILEAPYNRKDWSEIMQEVFGAQKIHSQPPQIGLNNKLPETGKAYELGSLTTTDSRSIGFYEVEIDEHLALEKNRVGLRKMLRSVYKYDVDGAVIVFRQQEKWRLSFVSEIRMRDKDDRIINFETEPKRFTYLLGKGEQCRTATERLKFISGKRKNLKDIIEAFSVDELTKEFYIELSHWYHRAIKSVDYPGLAEEHQKDEDAVKAHKAKNVIRLITRLVFVWFLKQKIPAINPLFDEEIFDKLIISDPNNSTYYKAILQNLFFATFNTHMNKDQVNSRRWVKEGRQNNNEFLDQRYYRYKQLFKNPEEAISLFEEIPFLNGGLFDNLDYRDKVTGKAVRIDCFSTTKKNEKLLTVPDELFWKSAVVDLSKEFNSAKKKEVPVHGIIEILKRYNFTLEENTPLEKEVALDPELLGKVFENLLASYNPETQTPARNQTGSFYTPREIVNFQVDEALKAYLLEKLTGEKVTSYAEFGKSQLDAFGNEAKSGQLALVEDSAVSNEEKNEFRKKLDILFDYNTTENPFDKKQTEKLVYAIDHVKIIDPANGTGAYPMGALLRMVELLKKLDPNNQGWKARQLEKIEEIEDPELRQKWREDVEAAFQNNPDYGRKLYLIEECLFGVDIQPIACQISKLRFFISLIVDQKIDFKQPNFGIKALPNLETRFVAADSLVPLEDGRFIPEEVYKLKKELRKTRDAYFVAKSRETKKKRQKEDEELRQKIAQELKDALFPPSAADAIAAWNPYDQNKSSAWFNADWMFGVNNDFDIVIGNPPYIQLQKDGGKLAKKYEPYNYNTFTRTGDIYSLFYERGMKLMQGHNGNRKEGVLTYITSNKWMRAGYGAKTRNYFAKKTNPLLVVDFSNVQIFESATVDTCIMLLQNNRPQGTAVACRFNKTYTKNTSLTSFIEHTSHPIEAFKADQEWVIMDPETTRIKKLVESEGKALKDWEIRINYGLKTGLNEAFIIDRDKKEELIKADPKNAEVIKPILRGKDIQKWYPDFADKWLIALIPARHLRIKDYPTIQSYFEREIGRKRLEQSGEKGSRKRTTHQWFELQDSIAYWQDFEQPKIIYPEMTKYINFLYDDTGYYTNNKCFILSGQNIEYLCCFLNSKLFRFCFLDNFPELQGGTRELRKIFMERIPVKEINDKQSSLFKVLHGILKNATKEKLNSVNLFEQVVNGMLFDLYFEEEMHSKDLSIMGWVEEDLAKTKMQKAYNQMKEEDYLKLADELYKTWTDPFNEVRNRLKLFATRSPDLLAPILKTE